MASSFLISAIFLSLLSVSSTFPSETVLDAAEILADFGFVSMALTIELASKSLPHFPSLTIFAPSDAAFTQTGKPPLEILQFHILPRAYSYRSLLSLPSGARISTLLHGHSVSVTTAPFDNRILLNNVTIDDMPVYDDGSLVIFKIDKLLDPSSGAQVQLQNNQPNVECLAPFRSDNLTIMNTISFVRPSASLRSKGYNVMASFLDLQFLELRRRPLLTIFAPTDKSINNIIRNSSLWPGIFRRHIVRCTLLWDDLMELGEGTLIQSYLEGFHINITRSEGNLLLNNVRIIFPNMYYSDWIVIHGLQNILPDSNRTKEEEEKEEEEEEEIVTSHSRFSVYRFKECKSVKHFPCSDFTNQQIDLN